MSNQQIAVLRKWFTCVAILLLCLLTVTDDVSDFWQSMNIGVAMLQSGYRQDDDGGDHDGPKTVSHQDIPCDAASAARQLSFRRACPDEIQRQAGIANRRASRNRAPPSFA